MSNAGQNLCLDSLKTFADALKAPDEPVRASDLRGRNRKQFNKFKAGLPNLVYTNGNEWILYQDGERIQSVCMSGNITEDGADAVEERKRSRGVAYC